MFLIWGDFFVATVKVSTTSQLVAALKNAKDGDVIALNSGNYSSVRLDNFDFKNGVTITSVNPDKPAVLTDLMVQNSGGLTFSNLEFAAGSNANMFGFQFRGTHDIKLDNLDVHATDGPNGYDVSPLMIRNSTGVEITNSDFHHSWHGVTMLDNTDVTITNNEFYDIRTDGIRGGGISDLVVSGNVFTDFHPKAGDHPDAIQLWSTNQSEAAKNIVISDNMVVRGDGDAFQGIFIKDTFGKLPFENVTISDNLIVGAMYNGIAVNGAKGLSIDGNTVSGFADQKSWLRVDNGVNTSVTNNKAESYIYQNTTPREKANVTIETASDFGLAAISTWLNGQSAVAASLLDSDSVIGAKFSKYFLSTGSDSLASKAETEAAHLATIETVQTGTAGADRLVASGTGDNRIDAGAGNDMLTGAAIGTNILTGGAGDDSYIVKGAGDVVVELANGGNDTVTAYVSHTLSANVETLRLAEANLVGTGNALDNKIVGSAGADTIYGLDGADSIQAQDGNDIVYGGNDDDVIRGEGGNDTLYGDAGNDKLYGGDGDDVIVGGADNDVLEGGAGADVLTGGAGADTFIFRGTDIDASGSAPDVITDFSRVEKDRISLSMIDAKSATDADDGFKFIGTNAFSKQAGELRYTVSNGDSYVSGDTNGDGIADFTIIVKNMAALQVSDFLL